MRIEVEAKIVQTLKKFFLSSFFLLLFIDGHFVPSRQRRKEEMSGWLYPLVQSIQSSVRFRSSLFMALGLLGRTAGRF
jgi:hypothetical protein